MNSLPWTADRVIANHARNIFLWYKQEGKTCCRVCLLWVIYENKKPVCTLSSKGESLKQAHRLTAEEMASYLEKYTATVPLSNGATKND